MSTPDSSDPELAHAPEEAARWFNQWHVYRAIVDANWLAHEMLAPRGSLLYADVFRRDHETREEYLEAYVGMMRRAWTGMPSESLASTVEHVTQRDFPGTSAALSAMAHEAGFGQEPRELFRDATGFHRLLAFTRSCWLNDLNELR